jgi:hypothetical protein
MAMNNFTRNKAGTISEYSLSFTLGTFILLSSAYKYKDSDTKTVSVPVVSCGH